MKPEVVLSQVLVDPILIGCNGTQCGVQLLRDHRFQGLRMCLDCRFDTLVQPVIQHLEHCVWFIVRVSSIDHVILLRHLGSESSGRASGYLTSDGGPEFWAGAGTVSLQERGRVDPWFPERVDVSGHCGE